MSDDDVAAAQSLEDFWASTLFLYQSWPPTTKNHRQATCGCAVPRDAWVTAAASSPATAGCPLCNNGNNNNNNETSPNNKIVAILDGYAHSLQGNNKDASSSTDQDPSRPLLSFKYGAVAYHVGLPRVRPPSNNQQRSRSFWFWFLSSRSSNKTSANDVYYAQDHVAYLLGLESTEMKVLCKGKVLYPSPNSEMEISNRLIQESSATANFKATPRLLVMGTPHAQQLQKPPSQQSSMWLSWLQWITSPWIWFFQSFLAPFLPEALQLTTTKRD